MSQGVQASGSGRVRTAVGAALAAGLILHGVALLVPPREARPGGWPPAALADGVTGHSVPGGTVWATAVKDGTALLVWNPAAGKVEYYEADLRLTPQSGSLAGVFHGSATIPQK